MPSQNLQSHCVEPRGVIFDLDGTLVDSLNGIATATNVALQQLHLPLHSLENIRHFIGNGATTLLRRAAPAELTDREFSLLEKYFKIAYAAHWQSGTRVYAGIQEMLTACRKRKLALAVLSNKPHSFTQQMVDYFFPMGTFKSVMGHQVDFPHKPDPASALATARVLKLKPQECCFVGDSTIDVETANRAGMPAIAVCWGFHHAEQLLAAGAQVLVDDPVRLLENFTASASLER